MLRHHPSHGAGWRCTRNIKQAVCRSKVKARGALEDRMQSAYSMADMYATDRPEAIPVEQHVQRQRVKDVAEITQAAKRRGVDSTELHARLAQLEGLLPGVVNLQRMRAVDWVTVCTDIDSATLKLVLIKSHFPAVDALRVVTRRPKLLLLSMARLEADVAKVSQMLSSAPASQAVIEANPDFLDPLSLSRALSYIASSFPGQDPVAVLQRDPTVMHNVGESTTETDAEYGELSTKD